MKKKVNYLHNNVKKDERKVEDGIKWNWKKSHSFQNVNMNINESIAHI